GNRLPPTGLEPLFNRLFRRFGIPEPVPAAPGSPAAFENPTAEKDRADQADFKQEFFLGELNVRERASLYTNLLHNNDALKQHRRTQRVLDRATDGKHSASRRRRERARPIRELAANAHEPELPTLSESEIGERSLEGRRSRMAKLEDLQPGATVKGILPD